MIATDGEVTTVFLLYAQDSIQWTTGDNAGGLDGLGGNPATAGLRGDSSADNFTIPSSNTADIINIEFSSNVMIDGLWIFRVDGDIIFPSKCDALLKCSYICRSLLISTCVQNVYKYFTCSHLIENAVEPLYSRHLGTD